jgi:hypothetical protein
MGPPPGPALVEIPTNVLYARGRADEQRPGARVYDRDALQGQRQKHPDLQVPCLRERA